MLINTDDTPAECLQYCFYIQLAQTVALTVVFVGVPSGLNLSGDEKSAQGGGHWQLSFSAHAISLHCNGTLLSLCWWHPIASRAPLVVNSAPCL